MTAQPDSFGARAKRTFTRLLVTLVVVALGALALVLVSQLNARTFRVEQQGTELVVLKGRMAPMGAKPWHPGDAALADAYAPIPLDGISPGDLVDRRFSDRDELDRALFDLLEREARPRITSDDPAQLDRGLYYVHRAERLSGLTEDQRRSLKAMQAEVSFYLARSKLDDARRQIAEAMAQLRIAAESNTRNSRSAHQMIGALEQPSQALEEALRTAVHSLSSPPAPEPPAAKPPPAQPRGDAGQAAAPSP